MARGPKLKLLGKAAAFVAGDLLERELGINTTSKRLAFSTTGSDLIFLPQSREVLLWTGSAYPAKPAGVTFALYIGPTDPMTVGVTLASGDAWEATTSPLYVKLAANVANSTTTLAESGLSLPVKAGVTYDIEAKIHYDSSIATSNASGVKWGISGPAASLISVEEHHTGNPNGTTFWHWRGAYTPGSTPASNNSALNGNMATFVGALTPTADGDFKIQFAPNVASQTITLLPASRMRLTPIL